MKIKNNNWIKKIQILSSCQQLQLLAGLTKKICWLSFNSKPCCSCSCCGHFKWLGWNMASFWLHTLQTRHKQLSRPYLDSDSFHLVNLRKYSFILSQWWRFSIMIHSWTQLEAILREWANKEVSILEADSKFFVSTCQVESSAEKVWELFDKWSKQNATDCSRCMTAC